MGVKEYIRVGFTLLVAVMVPFALTENVYSQASSTNYRLEEASFGSGGEVDASSASYRAQQQAGSLGVGDASSTNYDATAGGVTQGDPFLEMSTTGATVNFGTLSPSTTSYGSAQAGACNCSFYVRTYVSSEYSVVSVSQPPVNEAGVYLTAKSVLGAPSGSASVEEFGMNLVANTVPGTFGSDPTNIPDNSFADGKIETGYDTPDQFKFGVGDIIARSPATSGNPGIGQTNYTISYIAKPSNVTAAGTYTLQHVLVVVPAF